MRQRVHLITLGIADMARAAAFYDALGWERVADTPPGIVVYDLFGAALGLYPREAMARDMALEGALDGEAGTLPPGSGSMVLSCNVREKHEVAETLAAAEAAGARTLKAPHDVFWGGHVAFFADPEGHMWEIAFNPFAPLGPDDQFRWNGFGEGAA